MTTPWLILDVSYLAYRAFHSMGELSHEGVKTGVVYGMFRAIIDLQELHATDRVVWCFDRGHDKRSQIWGQYKANRHKQDEDNETKEARRALRQQLYRLRTNYLPAIGYRNVFWQYGYEADDVIASICQDRPRGEEIVIVASDADLYQLLIQGWVSMWNPQKKQSITAESFSREWGIDPTMWSDVKSIAGCPGDNVQGVKGVGEKTAVRFLTGKLKDTTKAFAAIVANRDVWERNLHLTRLPFKGTERFELVDDCLTRDRWNMLMERLGMKSLVGRGR